MVYSERLSLIVDIVKSRQIESQMLIPFDTIIKDDFGLFSLANASFEVPWNGNFTFNEIDFRCQKQDRDIYIAINGKKFGTSDKPVTKYLETSDKVSFTRGAFESVDLICSKEKPCRLEIYFEP